MKKRVNLLFFSILFSISIIAQESKGYQFETIYDLDATAVCDQHRSGTCWSFSGQSFLESEMIRIGKKPVILSQMFVVRHCYSDKAVKYVRMHGETNFGSGGAFHDVLYVLKNYGAVPETIYDGLQYGENKHVHGEIDAILKNYVDAVVTNPNKKLTPSWHQGFNSVLDAYFGELPENFTIEGKSYTPKSYAKEVVALNPEDYVQIGSFTHHPFYTNFIIEIPDNWMWGKIFNVPLDELITIMTESIKNGFTIGWATDVSEKGFSHKNGIAIVPETELTEMQDSEREKWETLSKEEREKRLYSFDEPLKEMIITQEIRQEAFDNHLTTDDHGMHITGLAKDQYGTIYFKVKNSWNTDNVFDGYLYASETYVKYKTISIMVHKNAIPKNIRTKLGL
ncbi:MAG: C1 family peptidase [Marinilabiliaceae bacterium]|nr:C1 family peptidase [Marinilabiliaceae bacterium]